MSAAIEEMWRSRSEHVVKPDPMVGAVLVNRSEKELGRAHRGNFRTGEHSEFTLLEKVLPHIALAGCTLYVTLEPCSERTPPKKPCAQRIVEEGIARVVIGMPDPNPDIHGRGISHLLKHGVQVDFFDPDLREQIREANKDFITHYEGPKPRPPEAGLPSYERSLVPLSPPKPFGGPSYEERQPVPSATVGDLSRDAIQEYLEARRVGYRIPSQDLWHSFKKAGFLAASSHGRRPTPTLAGLALFGASPDHFLPQCKIKADCSGGRLRDGSPLVESASAQRDISGPLTHMVRDLEAFFRENVATVPHIVGSKRVDDTEYPWEVIREAIVNALVHRDYQEGRHVMFQMFRDAIAVKSPGSLLPPLTLERIQAYDVVPLSRNPHIAAAMNDMRYMEERAVGIRTMRDRLVKHGLREPDFACDLDCFVATIYGRESSPATLRIESETLSRLNSRQRRILDILGARGRITSLECIREFAISRETANQDFDSLLELGLITRLGRGKGTYYVGRF